MGALVNGFRVKAESWFSFLTQSHSQVVHPRKRRSAFLERRELGEVVKKSMAS